jgi:hypothetical protein
MNRTLICWQYLYLIKDQRIKILEHCFIDGPISRDRITCMLSLGDRLTWINTDWGFPIALKYNIISGTFNKSFASSSWNRMSTKLPRWDIQDVISEIILYLFIWISELINIVPQWVFAMGDRMPPSF